MLSSDAAGPIFSWYVHVPFCAHKCEYCAFYSHAPNGEVVNRYVSALIREFELLQNKDRPRTVFFGGGTPSLLNLQQWERVLRAMDQFGLLGADEWTVECNPATISLDKAKLLRSFGVNRISMGVQSLNPALLERLGRIHSREMVFKSFDCLRAAGFTNINLDLIFAIPGQTFEIWCDTILEAVSLGSEHLSCYEIIYEEDTPLFAQLHAGRFDVDEALASEMYDLLVDQAGTHGFKQYEIANFARVRPNESGLIPDQACQHNLNYWRGGEFNGLGPSATSYRSGIRTKNWSNTTMYCELLEKGCRAIESREQLSSLRRAGETAAFGLRMTAGWGFEEFMMRTGYDLRTQWMDEMQELAAQGLAELTDARFRLTNKGLRFADLAAEKFIRLPENYMSTATPG